MIKKLRIKNSKGLQLSAVIERPEGESKFPFVILLHGFTGWKEEKHIVSLAKLLTENGIGSIRFDASGSGESEGTFFNDYRLSNYISDVDVIYEYLLTQNFVNGSRIAVWGHSMGGQTAVYFASRHPELKALCSCQGSNNIKKSIRHLKQDEEWRKAGFKVFSNSHFDEIKLPYEFFEDRKHFNSADAVSSIVIPKLIIAGGRDQLVPAVEVKKVFVAAPEPKNYYEHSQADHFYKNYPDILDEINQRTLEFFQTNL